MLAAENIPLLTRRETGEQKDSYPELIQIQDNHCTHELMEAKLAATAPEARTTYPM